MRKATRFWKIAIAAITFYAMSWFAAKAEGGSSGTDSLIVNGGFEQEVAGIPVGWSQDAWKTDGSTVFRLEHTENGIVAVVENIQPNDARWSQKVKVEPDTIYRLSGRVRAENVGMSATGANLTVLGILETSRDLKGTTGWEEVHLVGRTGKNQREITVTARLGGYGNLNTGKAFLTTFDWRNLTPRRTANVSSLSSRCRRAEKAAETTVRVKMSRPVRNGCRRVCCCFGLCCLPDCLRLHTVYS